MSKKILILETSVTVQKLFTTTLDSNDYTIQFVSDGKKAIYDLFEFQPDLFLMNSGIQNPRSFEVLRLVRSLKCFSDMTIAMYSNSPTPLDESFSIECGATSFVRLDQKTLVLNIDELAQLSVTKIDKLELTQIKKKVDDAFLFSQSAELSFKSSCRNVVYSKLARLSSQIENIEEMARTLLNLIAEICEVPIVSIYIIENDGPHGYYVAAENLGEKEISDFLNVSITDFEKIIPECNASKVVAKAIEKSPGLNRFYTEASPLSSYESRALGESEKNIYFGSVQLVSVGNLTSEQQEFFKLCVDNAGDIFSKALIFEKKIFFERRIRQAFGRFVPAQIIDTLVEQSDENVEEVGVGETRTVAILFSDIRSFTNISEKNKPDVLVSFLNRYFTVMVDIIQKHGGTIDKFIGDAIMAEFGTPVSYEDNCARAVAAASEMRDALETIEIGDLVLPEGMKFDTGIGIHYGDVIVGSIGSKDKTDYSVIGDNVNLASRLEGLTKTYGAHILVSDSVFESAGENNFCFRHLDDVRVKGKKNAVPIYAVDKSENEFSFEYKDSYSKGMDLYKKGIWNLARDYFDKALQAREGDKAANLLRSRCDEFIKNPPENWDGAIAFNTK